MSIDDDGLRNKKLIADKSLRSNGIDGVHIDCAEMYGRRSGGSENVLLLIRYRWR